MRFTITLLAVCLLLIGLGVSDVAVSLRNPAPVRLDLAGLTDQPPEADWLTIEGATLDLAGAVSTSGSLELDALLVPLTAGPGDRTIRVMLETRDPQLLTYFQRYHFGLDDPAEQAAFLAEHGEVFASNRARTGMLATGATATGNRQKLLQLARESGMTVDADVLFLSEGKTPPRWSGYLMLAVGLAGLVKCWRAGSRRFLPGWRAPQAPAAR
ncbi:hypothetical protein [Solidesulfovibrio sp.]